MRITLLGTGGYHPSECRHTSCILLPDAGIVFDAGTAAFRIAGQAATRDLDVFLTHGHLDHVVGLTYLLEPLVLKKVDTVRVYAAAPVIDAVRTHVFAPAIFPVLPEFEFCPLEREPVAVAQGAIVSWQPLSSHPGASMGFRLDWNREGGKPPGSLAYITDTSVDGTYTDFVRGVDLLIHECYFPDDRDGWATKTGHSHTAPVLELAREAGVGRLVLTHIDPRSSGDDPLSLVSCISVFPNTIMAQDGLTLDV